MIDDQERDVSPLTVHELVMRRGKVLDALAQAERKDSPGPRRNPRNPR
ncbi:hypothetical protein [Streptomyces alfalfae]|nr:hypothetical protein [Streptomyces alfalfae]